MNNIIKWLVKILHIDQYMLTSMTRGSCFLLTVLEYANHPLKDFQTLIQTHLLHLNVLACLVLF